MSVQPEPFDYQPPALAELYEHDMVLFPGETCSLHCKQWTFKGKVVNFALSLRVLDATKSKNPNGSVARYDCCHSEVHKHQFYRSGKHYKTGEPEQRTVIAPIDDPKTAWDTVDKAYDSCYDDIAGNWETNYRRWDTDGRSS